VDPKLLYPLKHRGEDSQAHMAIIRSRQALVDCRTQLVNPGYEEHSSPSVSSLAQVPGQKLPQQSGRAHPRGTPAGPGSHPGAEVGSLTQRIRDYDRQLEEISKESYPQETELLRQVEGIGPLTALTFVLTLEDPYRFQKSRNVGAYLGLVPARDQSGDSDPREKRISKEGEEMLSVGFW
jgi:transposase